jgi:hypothetical protein
MTTGKTGEQAGSNMPGVGRSMLIGVSIVLLGIVGLVAVALMADGSNRIAIFGFAAAIVSLVGAVMRLVAHIIGLGPRRGTATPAAQTEAKKKQSEWDGVGKALGVMAATYAVSLAVCALPLLS